MENHLETLIIKHFDPKKADSIFSAEGEVIYRRAEYRKVLCTVHFYAKFAEVELAFL